MTERARPHLAIAPVSTPDRPAEPQSVAALPALHVPRERRPGWATLAALATATGAAALGLGCWALVTQLRAAPPSHPREVAMERAVAILASPSAERVPFAGSVGRIVLVVDERGRALLTLNGLGRAPEGRVYQAWIFPLGAAAPTSAGLFDATKPVVPLWHRVPHGSRVTVTLELAGGARAPTKTPKLTVTRT